MRTQSNRTNNNNSQQHERYAFPPMYLRTYGCTYIRRYILKSTIQALYAATFDKTVFASSGKPLYVHLYNAVTVNLMPSLPISVLPTVSTTHTMTYVHTYFALYVWPE